MAEAGLKGESNGDLKVKRGKSPSETAELIEGAHEAQFLHEITSPEECMQGWLLKLNSDGDASHPESWRERLCEIQDGNFWYTSHKTGGRVKLFAMTNVRDVVRASHPDAGKPHAFKVELKNDSSVTFAVKDEENTIEWIKEIQSSRKPSSSQTSGLETLSSDTRILPRPPPLQMQRTASFKTVITAKAHSAYESVVHGQEIRYVVSRQVASALGVQWWKRALVLTHERVCFTKITGGQVSVEDERWLGEREERLLDYIPIHEIAVLHPLGSEEDKLNGPISLPKTGSHNSTVSMLSQGSMGSFLPSQLTRSPHSSSFKSTRIDPFELDDKDPNCVVVIETMEDGYNHGRRTIVHFDSQQLRDSFVGTCRGNIRQQKKRLAAEQNPGLFRLLQRGLRALYCSPFIQTMTLAVISASFLTSLVHAQMRPEHGSSTQFAFLRLEEVYAALFAMELSLALFALGPKEFFASKSRVFDAIVVVICVSALVLEELPSSMSAFRFLRIARLVRIFGLLRSVYNLRILIISLSNAAVPVLYSFLLMGMVLSMFAVMATELFSEVDPANFGDLERAGFTLFQVATGDSWASSITRGITDENPKMRVWIHLFFVVFFLIVGLVLMNVFVAILLDEFLGTIAKEKADQKRTARLKREYEANMHRVEQLFPLDPLLACLVSYTTEDDLMTKIASMYEKMDLDNSGSLSLEELNRGLQRLDFGSHVQISAEDFEMLAAHGKYLNVDMELGPRGFELMIMEQLKLYTNRRLVSVMKELDFESVDSDQASHQSIIVLALKMMLSNLHQLRDSFDHLEKRIDPLGGSKASASKAKKTKTEVMLVLKNLVLRRAFSTWAEQVVPAMSDREVFEARMDQLEAKLNSGVIALQQATARFDASVLQMASKLEAVNAPISPPKKCCEYPISGQNPGPPVQPVPAIDGALGQVQLQERARKPADYDSAKARSAGNPTDAARARIALLPPIELSNARAPDDLAGISLGRFPPRTVSRGSDELGALRAKHDSILLKLDASLAKHDSTASSLAGIEQTLGMLTASLCHMPACAATLAGGGEGGDGGVGGVARGAPQAAKATADGRLPQAQEEQSLAVVHARKIKRARLICQRLSISSISAQTSEGAVAGAEQTEEGQSAMAADQSDGSRPSTPHESPPLSLLAINRFDDR